MQYKLWKVLSLFRAPLNFCAKISHSFPPFSCFWFLCQHEFQRNCRRGWSAFFHEIPSTSINRDKSCTVKTPAPLAFYENGRNVPLVHFVTPNYHWAQVFRISIIKILKVNLSSVCFPSFFREDTWKRWSLRYSGWQNWRSIQIGKLRCPYLF